MTDDDRARLERAREHPAYREAMDRPPQDFAVPVLLVAAFYLAVPLIFMAPLFSASGADLIFATAVFSATALPAIPFVIAAIRIWPLRALPARHVFGLITDKLDGRRPGRWIRVETADGTPVDLRLRLKAYFESTGGAVGPGRVGVALCKGDQMVEWVDIPDAIAAAE
jgi:hypothetical protein